MSQIFRQCNITIFDHDNFQSIYVYLIAALEKTKRSKMFFIMIFLDAPLELGHSYKIVKPYERPLTFWTLSSKNISQCIGDYLFPSPTSSYFTSTFAFLQAESWNFFRPQEIRRSYLLVQKSGPHSINNCVATIIALKLYPYSLCSLELTETLNQSVRSVSVLLCALNAFFSVQVLKSEHFLRMSHNAFLYD